MTPTTIPLRLGPFAGESWLGFTRRLANRNGVSWPTLMAPLFPIGSRRPYYPFTAEMSGVTAAPESIRVLADYFGLTGDQVGALLLSSFNGGALSITDDDTRRFDPFLSVSTQSPRSTTAMGFINSARLPRTCPVCSKESPGRDELSWRLGWHLICTRHEVLVTRIPTTGNGIVPATQEQASAQAAVLSHLAPNARNREFFRNLDELARLTMGKGYREQAMADPVSLVGRLPAFVKSIGDPGFPLGTGLITDPSTCPPLALVRPPASRSPSAWDIDVAWIPRLVPLHRVSPELSDLCFPTTPNQARVTAALAAYMWAFGCTLADAGDAIVPGRTGRVRTAARILLRIEGEGRLERFWDAVAQAVVELVGDAIDYRRRERALADPTTHAVALASEPRAHSRVIRTWLVDQWACTFTSSNVRPSARTGYIEDFDREFGPAMREALADHVERAA